jgi:hypothetical protein
MQLLAPELVPVRRIQAEVFQKFMTYYCTLGPYESENAFFVSMKKALCN